MIVFLEHEHARALAHDEAVAILVVGTRRFLRRVVEPGRERLERTKSRHRDPIDRRFRSARDHHVGIPERDQATGIADRVRAGGTRGDDRMIGTFEPEFDRHIARGEIDDAAGNEERRYAPRAFFLEHDRGIRDSLDAADAGTDHHAGRDLLFVAGRLPAGIVERLARGAHRIDDEIVDLALLFRLHPLVGIEGAVAAVAAAGSCRRSCTEGRIRRSARWAWRRSRRRSDRCQVGSTPQASGVTIPIPVTTTRLMFGSSAASVTAASPVYANGSGVTITFPIF